MSSKQETAAIAGVGAVACAACCAGPIIGLVGALGLLGGVVLFGTIGLAVAVIALLVIVSRRRRQAQACATVISAPVVVDITSVRKIEGGSDLQHAPEPGLSGRYVQQSGRLGKRWVVGAER